MKQKIHKAFDRLLVATIASMAFLMFVPVPVFFPSFAWLYDLVAILWPFLAAATLIMLAVIIMRDRASKRDAP